MLLLSNVTYKSPSKLKFESDESLLIEL